MILFSDGYLIGVIRANTTKTSRQRKSANVAYLYREALGIARIPR